mmetsp:Transcript_38985/g.79788  ORF Transcript_38985/g.79788 Transcript_38985/m.79788 type:complete len:98 (+) Transcript_38985:193-486(+)
MYLRVASELALWVRSMACEIFSGLRFEVAKGSAGGGKKTKKWKEDPDDGFNRVDGGSGNTSLVMSPRHIHEGYPKQGGRVANGVLLPVLHAWLHIHK